MTPQPLKTCQYCRVTKTDQYIKTATGKRWKCEGCKKGRKIALKKR
jgi:hypothetical protein